MKPRLGDRMKMTRRIVPAIGLVVLLLMAVAPGLTLGIGDRLTPTGARGLAIPAAYTDHAAIYIDGNEDLLAQASSESWLGTGSSESPVTISGYRITDTGVAAVRIWNVDLHWVLSDCLLEGGPPYAAGIWLSNVSNGVISGNVIRNRDLGINAVDVTRNCSIIDNEIYDNDQQGIVSLNGMSNCIISGNDFHGNLGNNIWMTGGFNDSEFSDNTFVGGLNAIRILVCLRAEIRNNTVTDGEFDSIVIPSAVDTVIADNNVTGTQGTGIMTSGSNIEISGNVVSDCTAVGIYLALGSRGILQENTVSNCTEYGIKLGGAAENTTVTLNVLTENADGCQVEDDGEDNAFFYNYFSEWTSPDVDGNNIVDNPYAIEGDAENNDPYPLVDPDGPIPSTTTGTTSNGNQYLDVFPYVAIGLMVVLLGVAGFLRKRR